MHLLLHTTDASPSRSSVLCHISRAPLLLRSLSRAPSLSRSLSRSLALSLSLSTWMESPTPPALPPIALSHSLSLTLFPASHISSLWQTKPE